jgi:hypothetical protein
MPKAVKNFRLSSVEYKLRNLGVERTSDQIWSWVFRASCGRFDKAMELLAEIDTDSKMFDLFLTHIARNQIVTIIRECDENLSAFHGLLLASIGFVFGVATTLLVVLLSC